MKQFLFLPLLLLILNSYSQTIEKYYDYNWKECDVQNARFNSITTKTDSGWHLEEFYINLNSMQMSGNYEDVDCKIKNGQFSYFFPNRRLQTKGNYLNNKRSGLWLSYYENGMMSDSSNYRKGRKVGTCIGWHSNGFIADSIVLDSTGKGVYVSWFDNGNPSCVGRYSEGQKQEGRWKYYHKNGQLCSVEFFQKGKLIDKQYFDEQGVPMEDTTTKEKEAEFKGGIKAWQEFLMKNLYFPSNIKLVNADKIVVVIEFYVNEEGKVENAYVRVPFDSEFDKIALSVINKSPKWIPAFQNNRHVRYLVRQPVIFKQEEY